jgi:hypothetical protein
MKKGKNKMRLPNLADMSDVEAIHWYTSEVLRLSREGQLHMNMEKR